MSVSELIAALGGNQTTADLLGVTPQAVGNWKLRTSIPGRHHWRLYQICQERGIDWQPDAEAA